MNLKIVGVACSAVLLLHATVLSTPVELVKKKWKDQFDVAIEAEKARFLSQYGLDISCLNNDEVIKQLKESHDQLCKEQLELDQLNVKTNQEELNTVQHIASKVFRASQLNSVEIINNTEFDYDDMSVQQIYATDKCYVVLNVSEHVKKMQELESLLRHECSHIVHQDNLQKELIECMAWCNSNESPQEIKEKCYPLSRLVETRADVYAAINSPDHGLHLIAGLQLMTQKDDVLTHPKISERIALLEKIKAELDEATKL